MPLNQEENVTNSIEDTGSEGDDTLFGDGGNNILFGGAGNDVLSGGAGDDFMSGDAGNDVLTADAGNDRLHGGSGNDILSGGVGNDVLYGGAGNDIYLFNRGDGQDTIFSAGNRAYDRDTLKFVGDITRNNLWLERQADDLKVFSVTGDSVTIRDHYSESGIASIVLGDWQLTGDDITGLATAMSAFRSEVSGHGGSGYDTLLAAMSQYWKPLAVSE